MNVLPTKMALALLFSLCLVWTASGNSGTGLEDDFLQKTKSQEAISALTPQPCTDVLLPDTTYAYNYIGGIWQPATINVFFYNPAGQLTEEYQYEWDAATAQWRNDKWYTYTYNAAGDLTDRYRYDWRPSLGFWENEYWYTNTYDASHRRTQSIRKDWNLATFIWDNAVKYLYTYEANNDALKERIQQIWTPSGWQNETRYTYTNNAQGIRLENALYNWNPLTNSWTLDSRYLYSYNAINCLTTRTYQLWNGSAWVFDSKNEYAYNSQGYETQNIKFLWNSGSWSQATKEVSAWQLFDAAPTSTVLSNDSFDSNAPLGTLVGNFITTDPDDTQFTYSLVPGDGNNDQHNALFSISGNELFTNANFADSTSLQFYIFVQIEDGNGAVCTVAFVIEVIFPVQVSIAPAGPFCENEGVQTLSATPPGGAWGGAANAAGQVNPAALGAGAFNVTYSYTAQNGASGSAQTTVVILAAPLASIQQPGAFCENEGVQTFTASLPGGIWGGVANAAGQVNPAALGAGTHLVTYSFTAANGCSNSTQINILVNAPPVVSMLPAGPFCQNEEVQTLLASPAGGAWGGAANAGGQVDPAALGAGSHLVIYTFTDANGCSKTAQLSILILAVPVVSIAPSGSFCKNAGVQTLAANPPGGSWGGVANANGQVDPNLLGTGSHSATYTFTDANGCSATKTVNFTVNDLPTATISGSGAVCEGSGDTIPLTISASGAGILTVNYTVNGNPKPPLSISASPFTLEATTPGSYEIVSVTDANGCSKTGVGTAEITSVGAPSVSNLSFACDNTNTSYTVSFEITGGDAASYSVSGGGSLSQVAPYIFTSEPLASGSDYLLVLNDANNCAPVTLSGNFSCNCGTKSGTMNPAGAAVCAGETAILEHSLDEILDGNDTLLFVLHDGSATSLGNILFTKNIPQFDFTPPLQYGVTYFVAAVAGNKTAVGVDFSDPCLSVSLGAPILFNPLPAATLEGEVTLCEGESSTLVFNLTGNEPFDVTYSDGSAIFSLENIYNGFQLPTSPSFTTTYTLLTVSDGSNPACASTGGNAVKITVNEPVISTQILEICQSETVFLAGAAQSGSGIYFDTLPAANGCDSVVVTTLIVNALDTTWLDASSCDPASAGVFQTILNNQHGCDSLVIQTVAYVQADTTYLGAASCDPGQAGTAVSYFAGQNGCDSVVVTTTFWLPSDTTFLLAQSCNPQDTGMFVTILSNQNGCDSLIFETTSLLPPPQATTASLHDFNGFGVSCAGASDGKIKVTVAGGSQPPFSYAWSNGAATPTVSNLPQGSYEVTVSSANGCTATASVTLNEPPPLQLDFSVKNIPCDGSNGGEIFASAGGGVAPYLFSLNDGDFLPGNLFSDLANAPYKVEIQDANGCETSGVAVVDTTAGISVDLGGDQNIKAGESVTLIALVDIPPDEIASVTWTGLSNPACPDCLEQVASPLITTSYAVSVVGKNGCTGTASTTLTVEETASESKETGVFVPNVFSPNGDGVNDNLPVFAGSDVAMVLEFKIFSRQGQLVFKAENILPNDLTSGWDGAWNGRVLDTQEFVFFAKVKYSDGREKLVEGGVALVK